MVAVCVCVRRATHSIDCARSTARWVAAAVVVVACVVAARARVCVCVGACVRARVCVCVCFSSLIEHVKQRATARHISTIPIVLGTLGSRA